MIPVLSPQQEQGLALLRRVKEDGGVGVLMGPGGSGKSTGLNIYRGDNPRTLVAAPTGIAATNVGGISIDRLMGWRVGHTQVKQLNQTNRKKLLASGVLVKDEFSMQRADKWDRLDRDLRTTFKNQDPFGGIGLFLIGDPFQLEPVVPSSGIENEYWQSLGYESPFFFDSHVWKRIRPEYVVLDKIFRQEGNTQFRDALNQIRLGDWRGLEVVNSRHGEIPADGSIKLCFRNADADEINRSAFNMASGDTKVYYGKASGDFGQSAAPSPHELALKVGCRVIATVNEEVEMGEDPRYVNGDMGTVVKLEPDCVLVEFDNGKRIWMHRHKWSCGDTELRDGELFTEDPRTAPTYEQIPLKHAYGISVHKSQGMTLEKVHLENPKPAFAHGLSYVALSRCRHLGTLSILRKLERRDLIVHPRVTEWWQEMSRGLVAA